MATKPKGNPASGYMNPNAPGNQSAIPVKPVIKPVKPVIKPVAKPKPTPKPTPKPVVPVAPVVPITESKFGPFGGLSSGAVAGVFAPTGYDEQGNPTGVTGTVATGAGTNPPSGGDIKPPEPQSKNEDAFALLKETFRLYGLEDLFPSIEQLMRDDVGPEQASLLLKTDPRYNAKYIERFSGNEGRRKAGLNVLSEAEYLALEDSYSQTLKAYGVSGQFGVDRKARQAEMANLISGDISATEFKDRIQTVVTRVENADPSIKSTMASFYGIKESDLISYFLKPKENLPKLQEKVAAAEIGAAARGQNLETSVEAATALAKFGVDRQEALKGYEAIGEVLPTASKLGDIYGDKYTQETAEQEVFKGLASAKRKRQQLAEREIATFSGSSGRQRTGRPEGNAGRF